MTSVCFFGSVDGQKRILSWPALRPFYFTLFMVVEFFRSVREVWIKAKYVEKTFVKQTTLPNADEKPTSTVISPSARRWSVYKRKRKHTVNDSTAASVAADTDSSSAKGFMNLFILFQ